MKNYKAGYICDAIKQVIKTHKSSLNKSKVQDQIKLDQINGLLQYVSSFDVHFPYQHVPDFNHLQPILATINNIITRGLPTRTPLILEQTFEEIGLCVRDDEKYEFNFPISKSDIKYDTVFDLLHIIEPHLNISKEQYGGDLGSDEEWHFLHRQLKNYPFAKQIFQSQRDFATINKSLGGGRSVDFSFEFPYHNSNNTNIKKKGIIFEYDGQHHKLQSFKYYDRYRDNAAEKEGFETLRQVSGEKMLNKGIENQFKKEIFTLFKKNYEKSISEHLIEYSLIFIPLAIARIKKTLIEFLLVHEDFFKKQTIKIAIIERDLPCGAIAVQCLKDLFTNINELLEDKDKLHLPNIELTIFENSDWVINKKLHLNAKLEDETYFKQHDFDIIIDHSILRRSNIYKEADFQHDRAIKIRSSHFVDNSYGKSRRVYCANLLNYKALVQKEDNGSYSPIRHLIKPINYFIQNIFRKVSFREGQLPIISRALQQKPVVGLLPTGGGKSLTFQLSAFLQPGLCLVVDPIKSLMEDQVRVLKENWIDCCDYINSNLDKKTKNNKLIDFRYGETMFMFVSPERFVMEEFRTIIKNIDTSSFGLAFAYCVIDEVHCVSEWGHDFRSTYLMLGKNAQKFTKTKEQNRPVSLIGLTATASFDVLADIERELKIEHEDVANAIIMIENTIRPELFFRVIDVGSSDRMNELNQHFKKMGESLSKINTKPILTQSLAHHYIEFENSKYGQWDENSKQYILNTEGQDSIAKETEELRIKYELGNKTQNDFYSIIFCAVKGRSGNNEQGVDWVYKNLFSNSKGFYYASEDTDSDEFKKEIQQHFEDFTSDKTQHIVCTKAFGMGIDKDDIRSTYHFNYSSSLESLVQEAGRSGRDKKISEANILVSNNKIFRLDLYAFFRDNKEHSLLKRKFTRKAIRKAFESRWVEKEGQFEDIIFDTKEAVLEQIKSIDFTLTKKDGGIYNKIGDQNIELLRAKLLRFR